MAKIVQISEDQYLDSHAKAVVMRWIQFLTMVHRVHHIHYGYGWVFLPLLIGYFPEFREVFAHIKGGAKAWKFVNPKHFHDCTWHRCCRGQSNEHG